MGAGRGAGSALYWEVEIRMFDSEWSERILAVGLTTPQLVVAVAAVAILVVLVQRYLARKQRSREMGPLPHIVVVGGGAGGLELVTRLGKTLGRQRRANVTLVDATRTHIWKPLLHEVAAGTLDSAEDYIEYMAQASHCHFRFLLGRMIGLDRAHRQILLDALHNERGEEIIPSRSVPYDILVIAVGSVCNDFGIEGVARHCMFLDTTEQAETFQRRLIELYLRAQGLGRAVEPGLLDVAIVGGGATGVELSAQLRQVSRLMKVYGVEDLDPTEVKIHLIEAADRLLPGLPERLSRATARHLERIGIQLYTGERVVRVTDEGVYTHTDKFIPARLKVWAAGIKAPEFLGRLDGLETDRINRLVVRPTLKTTLDDRIYAIGDCAACPWPGKDRPPDATVPPRAQSAHQMADTCYDNIVRSLRAQPKPPKDYRYRDYGSLVSLGKYSTVGNLMGKATGSVMIEGLFARWVYLSLYKMHQLAVFGWFGTLLLTLAQFIRSRLHPAVKLH